MDQLQGPERWAAGVVAGAAERALLARATGVVMALVPCTAGTAGRILANVAAAAGTSVQQLAENVLAGRAHTPADPALEARLHAEIGRAQPLPVTPPRSVPINHVRLREYLGVLRAARRRALAAPDDADGRAELNDAAQALCLLTGQRNAHAALVAAEHELASLRER
ncbi:DUF5133 domain-containing protein [Streptomyces sp. WAC07149]|uniref:DUF5133 domain-containing protein n=1 Tax=Streptomyces sp. WAC07149 TaxID=2487425 RepID=UPI00163C911B|nr:DUF5133 domain-containing protein [Streptomyces sp. WAC07149]